jgi:cell division protein FtsI (penicillin-binding protein 3)
VLTLDRDVQHAAEVAASSAVAEFEANAATVVVLEVATGDVLAMASSPGYDPNVRVQDDQDAWRNRAITDVFEPGSTQKALTIAAAIEEGIVTARHDLEVPDHASASPPARSATSTPPEPTCPSARSWSGRATSARSRSRSKLGDQRLDHYLRAFGYGSPTGSGFPGEASGMLMPHEDWWSTSLPTIAIGHGVAVSLLQLAGSYATLANDGRSVAPRVVRGTVGDDGRLQPVAARDGQQVVSPTTARQVQQLLERVVSGDQGTGSLAAVPGYTVAGKTGTARKPATDGPGYSDKYVATFAGFAPAHDPQIVVAVMVDEPYPFYGGIVAAPVFSEVMEAALIARRVAPDGAATTLPAAMDHARAQALEFAEDVQTSLDENPPPLGPAGAPSDPTAAERRVTDRHRGRQSAGRAVAEGARTRGPPALRSRGTVSRPPISPPIGPSRTIRGAS